MTDRVLAGICTLLFLSVVIIIGIAIGLSFKTGLAAGLGLMLLVVVKIFTGA